MEVLLFWDLFSFKLFAQYFIFAKVNYISGNIFSVLLINIFEVRLPKKYCI